MAIAEGDRDEVLRILRSSSNPQEMVLFGHGKTAMVLGNINSNPTNVGIAIINIPPNQVMGGINH